MSEETESTSIDESPKSRAGCMPVAILVAAAMLGAGIYQMYRWDSIGGAGKSGAVVLIVLGTLVALPFLLVTGFKLFVKYYLNRAFKQMTDAAGQFSSGATEMLDGAKAMYSTIHEFRPATDDDFEDLNRDYYDQTTASLEARGFRHLGDIVDETIEEQGQISPPIRVLASADGSTGVAVYQVQLPFVTSKFKGKEIRIADVTTEFTDDTFAITSNTKELDMMTPPPAINSSKHPLETDVFALLDVHEGRKAALLAAKPGTAYVVVNTIDEALESERRQQAVKNAFRKQIDYLDVSEVRDIAKTVDTADAEVGDEFPEVAAKAVEAAKCRVREDDNG